MSETTYYWTPNIDYDCECYEMNADMIKCDSEHDAVNQALINAASNSGAEGIGDGIRAIQLHEGDCWLKVPAGWTRQQIHDLVNKEGVAFDHVEIKDPGYHPGGNVIWIVMARPVIGAINFYAPVCE